MFLNILKRMFQYFCPHGVYENSADTYIWNGALQFGQAVFVVHVLTGPVLERNCDLQMPKEEKTFVKQM